MEIRGLTLNELNLALKRVNEEYEGNLAFARDPVPLNQKGTAWRVRMRAVSSYEYGARLSWSGRHTPSASWEAFRDFFRESFALNRDAKIRTGMAYYKNEKHFEMIYPQTGLRNIGSQFHPVTMPELTL